MKLAAIYNIMISRNASKLTDHLILNVQNIYGGPIYPVSAGDRLGPRSSFAAQSVSFNQPAFTWTQVTVVTGGMLSYPPFRKDKMRVKDEDDRRGQRGLCSQVGAVMDFSNRKDTRWLSTGH